MKTSRLLAMLAAGTVLLSASFALTSVPSDYAAAIDVITDTGTYNGLGYTAYADRVEITNCDDSTSGTVTIPSSINGLPVTSIRAQAFDNCTKMTAIVFPDTLTLIGVSAFKGCTALSSVTIPGNVTGIPQNSFENCTSLTTVTIGAGCRWIDKNAFSGCTSLQSIFIPTAVQLISDQAFNSCSNLRSVYYGGSSTQWSAIKISSGNTVLSYANFYFNTNGITDLPATDPPQTTTFTTPPVTTTYTTPPATTSYTTPPVTTTYTTPPATTSYTTTYTTPETTGQPDKYYALGDLDGNNEVDATDAALILIALARIGAGADSGLSPNQMTALDVNKDGNYEATDASLVLQYAAYRGAGGWNPLENFLQNLG